MTHRRLVLLASLAIVAATASRAAAHCQIPCGIYDDPARFTMLEEHVTTIEKSMTEIERLSKEETPNYNQIVRWVNNKEVHADELSEIVTFYFMAQRVKPTDSEDEAAHAKYLHEITLLHEMVVYAMKAKQTTDVENCAKLRELIGAFKTSYLGEEEHTHDADDEHEDSESTAP
jgi:nickel superoxide dismutase